MSTINPVSTQVGTPPAGDSLRTDLAEEGQVRDLALVQLRDLLVRASRHQVWRLRDLLPGAGTVDLEDLAQQAADDALVAVLRQLGTFEGRSRFTTWVYKFGVLQAGVAVRRQAWRRREIHLPDTVTLVDTSPSPHEHSEAADLSRALQAAIATDLTPHQRRIVLALLVEGVPIDVLAERLGSTRNALYKTLHDARQHLRTSLTVSGHLTDGGHPDGSPS